MGFFETYLRLKDCYFEKTLKNRKDKNGKDKNGDLDNLNKLDDMQFRNFLIESKGKTIGLVKLFSDSITRIIMKPQRLLYDEEDFYIGIDLYTNTYYLCCKELMMIDIDLYKAYSSLSNDNDNHDDNIGNDNNIIDNGKVVKYFEDYCDEHLKKYNEKLKFKLYRSRNGIHAFLTSRLSNYKSDFDINMQLNIGSDFYYVVYSHLRGWSVRLNRKKNERNNELYEYIGDVGNGEPIERLEKIVDLHIKLTKTFANVGNTK